MAILTTRLGEYPAEPGPLRTHQFEVIGCSSYIERSGIGFIQNWLRGSAAAVKLGCVVMA
jgi:hypothetical protein